MADINDLKPSEPAPGQGDRALASVGGVDVRLIDAATADLSGFASVLATVFQHERPPAKEFAEFLRERWPQDRIIGAFDGAEVVACFRSWDWALSLPGGARATVDAISSVVVAPTHRRRGLLRAMITADLDAAARRGVCAAVLLAARATIYDRFGFGPAVRDLGWTLDVAAAQMRAVEPVGSVRFIDAEELLSVAPGVYERARANGNTDRFVREWRMRLGLAAHPQYPTPYLRHLVHRDATGQVQGFASYSWKEKWDGWHPQTTARLEDLWAVTDEAYRELFRVLINLDNVSTLVAENRPVDEPLPWMLTDHRAVRFTSVSDFLWARILDVPQALSTRGYEASGALDFVVRDPMGYAAGSYRVEIDAAGRGTCRPLAAESPGDLELDVDVLSSLWLGDGNLEAAGAVGRARENTSGALSEFAKLMHTRHAPWAPDSF